MIGRPGDDTGYDRLVAAAKELDDLRTYDGARARLDAGDDELVPAEVVGRLVEGENPLRVWREYRGFTRQQLSEASGVHRVQIAGIEASRKNGSVETVKKLAHALELTVDDLV